MPDKQSIVINTGPIIALIAARGNLNILKNLYSQVFVTYEVKNEICSQECSHFGANEFLEAKFLVQKEKSLQLSPILKNSLDIGEASVIQYALNNSIQYVCIDEVAGRRIARLNDLKVTGSLGILLKAKNKGIDINIREAIKNMQKKGIFLSNELIQKAIKLANE